VKVGANLAYGGLSPRELFKRSLVSVRVDTGVTLVINPTFPYLEGISRTFQATFKETAHADEGGWVSLGAPYEECRLVGRPARVKNRRATPQGRALADRVGLDPPPFLARVEATSVDDDEVMADGAHISRPLREFHVGEVIFHNCNEEGGLVGVPSAVLIAPNSNDDQRVLHCFACNCTEFVLRTYCPEPYRCTFVHALDTKHFTLDRVMLNSRKLTGKWIRDRGRAGEVK
jgi:hypothetical protein